MAYVALIAGIATLGGFLFGFDSGVINGTVEGLQTAFGSNSVGTGFSVSSMLLGSAVGALGAGRLADLIGRRASMLTAAVLFIVSAYGSGIAGGVTEFVLYRIIGGLAVGAASVLSPAYIAEVAPARFRGALMTLQQIAIVGGLFLAFLSNYSLASASGSALAPLWMGFDTWRWMFWIELIPATLFFAALFIIPESPRFLVGRGRAAEAEAVLGKIIGGDTAAKVAEIRETLSDDHKPRFSDLLSSGKVRPIVWVGIGLATFQQLVGINVIFYYGATLWQAAGFNENDALLINVISGAVSIAACFVAIFCVDKIGRKPLLLAGSIGMGIALGVMAIVFANGILQEDGSLQLAGKTGTVALIAANLYVFCFNFSWGPVMWIMLGEMFPNQIRGSGLAIAGLAQWLSNFAITLTFPMMLVGIGLGGAYGFYAVCAIISAVFIIKFVHETKGKELEEMQG